MRILIIQHDPAEGLGLLEETLLQKGWELDIRMAHISGNNLPQQLNSYRAMLILGGPMGAYEEQVYPYLKHIQGLVHKANKHQLPTLGICLGAQLIARALGAYVGPNPVKEIGWYQVELTLAGRQSFLFKELPNSFPVFQWHGDTFALPEGAFLLAQGKTCINQAFVYGDHICALQFHPEVYPSMIFNWTQIYHSELEDFGGSTEKQVLQNRTLSNWNSMGSVREKLLQNIEEALRGQTPFALSAIS